MNKFDRQVEFAAFAEVKKLGLAFVGDTREQLRYFTSHEVLPGEEGHNNIEVTLLDGTIGIIKSEYSKGPDGKYRWFEAEESIRRYPEEE